MFSASDTCIYSIEVDLRKLRVEFRVKAKVSA